MKIRPFNIAWFIPLAYLVHLIEEFYAGPGFPKWFSALMDVKLTSYEFLVFNIMGFSAVLFIAVFYSMGLIKHFVLFALGTLFFVNGLLHISVSAYTGMYSPGAVTSVLLFLPLGYVIFRNSSWKLSFVDKLASVFLGIGIQVGISLIAISI